MKQFDKTALLFEILLGSDMFLVNRKIEEIHSSIEYNRVCSCIPSISKTQTLKDIVDQFEALDIYGILSMTRALEVERQINEMDRRLSAFPSINPYLVEPEQVKNYSVSTVGNVNVEISAQGMKLNEFTTHTGVLPSHRKKIVKLKAFNWYKEAKASIAEMIETSKLFLTKIRKSRVRYKSLTAQYLVLTLITVAAVVYLSFFPETLLWRTNSFGDYRQLIFTALGGAMIFSYLIVSLLHIDYQTFGFRMASKVRQQVVRQESLITQLDNKSEKFERELVDMAGKPRKMNIATTSVGVINEYRKFNATDLLDYVYCESEYYHNKHSKKLLFHNIFFVLGFIASAAILLLQTVLAL